MTEVYIGVGGNIGDRFHYINKAIESLSSLLENIETSSFYKTLPRDYTKQDYFINTVVRGETDFSPLQLLDHLQIIEKKSGRDREKQISKGPRKIDLDILIYGNTILKEKNLTIPHTAMCERKFVLIPLLELNPQLRNPYNKKPYYKYLEEIEMQGVYDHSLIDYNNLFL